MSLINRFSTIDYGSITFVGNTLGLSPASPPQFNVDTIDVFTTIDTSLQVPGYPSGTTKNWNQNSASANLTIPTNSEILYAELIWGGTYQTDKEDLSALINNSISFTTPTGDFSITPDSVTAQEISFATGSGPLVHYYLRSAIVTDFIQQGQQGTYTVASVPLAILVNVPIDRAGGWTLQVVYKNSAMTKLQSLSTYVGLVNVAFDGTSVDTIVSGFRTPPAGSVSGRVLITAAEGDSCSAGDECRLGETATSTIPLSGPRNPVNNFFASQICDDTGNLDTSGTFGDLNQTLGSCQSIRRQGWDITNVSASNALTNNQSSAVVRLTTSGDGYVLYGFALQFDTIELITINKSVDTSNACLGDILIYTITIKNDEKGAIVTNSIFQDPIPTGTIFVPNSVTVNGVQTPGNPNDGVPIGDIAPGQIVTVTFQVKVEPNAPNPIRNIASVSADNAVKVDSNEVTTSVPQATLTVIKEADVGAVQCSGRITYTIFITNEGPDDLNQIEVLDPIDLKTTFVPNSVTVDGVLQAGVDLTTGIKISPFPAHTTKVIQFQVQVIPNMSGWIYNTAQVISCGTNVFLSNQSRVKICPCNS